MPPPKIRGKTSAKPFRFNPIHFIYVLSALVAAFALYNSISFDSKRSDAALRVNYSSPGASSQSTISAEKKNEPKSSLKAVEDPEADLTEEVEEDEIADEEAVVGDSSIETSAYELPTGFQSLLERAKQFQSQCHDLPLVSSEPNAIDVPAFGIVEALESYRPASPQEAKDWQCEVAPATECDIERFSVVFLGYSAERLQGVKQQIRNMLGHDDYKQMVEEVILVWNNPKPLNEAGKMGHLLYGWSMRDTNPFDETEPNRFRVFYPIEHGFTSSLMNRYHPMLKPKSRALLYYDDDGPFYNYRAIKSNFELWKRNSNVQTGAMSRAFSLSERQQHEKAGLLGGDLNDQKFVSHCRDQGDTIGYDYRFFENFNANMVLPSGSMIHRNYLCFIWHPALTELRKFVFEHLVHPDDMTVSTIVSHVSGRAPKPYSRRVPERESRRRLGEDVAAAASNTTSPEGMWRTKDWGKLRSIALNSVVAYFGGINSGSYGWCYKTKYHQVAKKGGRQICEPEMARDGMLPWMEPGGYMNDICPSSA